MISCIYIIKSTGCGRIYIGSTKNFSKRKSEHLSDLKYGIHSNVFIQRIFDKHGTSNFEFCILERVKEEHLLSVEQKYLDYYFDLFHDNYREKLLNIERVAGKPSMTEEVKAKIRAKAKGRRCTDETRQRMSAAKKGRTQSAEHVARRAASHVGKKRSEEARRRMREAKANRKQVIRIS